MLSSILYIRASCTRKNEKEEGDKKLNLKTVQLNRRIIGVFRLAKRLSWHQ